MRYRLGFKKLADRAPRIGQWIELVVIPFQCRTVKKGLVPIGDREGDIILILMVNGASKP